MLSETSQTGKAVCYILIIWHSGEDRTMKMLKNQWFPELWESVAGLSRMKHMRFLRQ